MSTISRLALLVVVLAGGAATPSVAQTATVTYYGNRCGTYDLPFLVLDLPRIGTTVRFQTVSTALPDGRSYSMAAIALGVSDRSIGGVPLPLDLSSIRWHWCGELLQSSEFYLPVPPGTWPQPTSNALLPIPNDATLVGLALYSQAFLASYCVGYCAPGLNPAIYASDAARLVVGR